ncbi:family 43 glycosylhydrolase [Halomonas sp. EGI 63088]|uniref:Family 43 glycosylhydrolase n=1 Tax=Halomonas flagellata TaxID=2920385 RepID=A0ABS9RVY9_9GAMM|nr:family 43 glycosylhydrolase [Halomonas flagellata]MCH4564011.1 family 43 glycosylhydrolase [Halomonas flagellata]
MSLSPEPLIEQRADPWILEHAGCYYFIASVPDYDRLEIRAADTIAGLAKAPATTVWRKPDTGPLRELIWAPELHHLDGVWVIYFAAAPSREIVDGLFQHRMYAITCTAADPIAGPWSEPQRIETPLESFCLDATTFCHRGRHYYVWAQKDPEIAGNSNLYIAELAGPDRLAGPPTRLSVPEYEWEKRGFLVNEGPAVLKRHGRLFLTYSASATDENYCVGLLWADADSDPLDATSWSKSPTPVLESDTERHIFGPGHSGFTTSEDGTTDLLVYHARTYTDIQGDPLWDPNRHTYVKPIRWDDQGFPDFGRAGEDTLVPARDAQ